MANVTLAVLLGLTGRAGGQDLPDLVLHVPTLAQNAREELGSFKADACELQPADLCVSGPGTRRLLRFSVLALNRGTADVFLGTPSDADPRFVYSMCHEHYHFESFAKYELRMRGETTVVANGRKRSFCVEDTQPDPDFPQPKTCTADADCNGHGRCVSGVCKYDCQYQGVQPGWGDLYPSDLPCQWIDVTDVPAGEYDLWVLLNTEQLLPESDYANDTGMVPVTIGAEPDAPVPSVKVRAKRKAKVGRDLKVAWKVRVKGGVDAVAVYDVWLSRDGGTTFPDLIVGGQLAANRRVKWPVPADAATEQAVVRVVAWTKALQRGDGTSRRFRIVP
ncbi:MAG: lysyl oxidase family protein [Candidatus Binatia bacterium]